MGRSDEVTVSFRRDVLLVKGAQPGDSIPMHVMAKVAKMAPKGAVLSPDVARLAGAVLAAGLPADIDALRAELAGEARARIDDWPPARGLSPEAREWLAVGRQGTSSAAIFCRATGVRPPGFREDDDGSWPLDVGDLARCRRLLESVPEARDGFAGMADLSPEWAALVAAWDGICEDMDAEAPDWRTAGQWHAPAAGQRLRAVLAGAAARDEEDEACA